MTILHIPTLVSFLAFLVLGGYVFLRNRRHLVNLFFGLAMASVALMEFGNFMALLYLGSEASLFWKRMALLGECLIPGTWLAFSMSFARKEPWYVLKEWKIAFIGIAAATGLFAAFIPSRLFVTTGDFSALLNLGGMGKSFYIFFLLGAVTVIAKLEHTIRQSAGDQRAKIRSLTLGVGGLFVLLIFTTSQILLFSQINLRMLPINSSTFIICAALIVFSVVRHRLMEVHFYMSRFVVYNTLTVLVVGVYLVFIGLVTQLVRSFDLLPGYHLEILFLFVAILALLGLFFSDRIRWRARMLINRHFYRSRYDYRQEWLKFAEGLSLKLDINDLVSPIVNMIQDSLGVKGVSLWLGDATTGNPVLARPDSSGQKKSQVRLDQNFLKVLVEEKTPFLREDSWARSFFTNNSQILKRFQPSLVVPMVSGRKLIGLILLGKKTTGEPFLSDDIDLLKSAGAQIASAFVNAKLSQELIETKEMETFHRLSSFVLHDLKNLVSSLSLIVQNAGEHMGNPQFQRDALETVGRSVERMEALIARLSSNTGALRPDLQETNLNEVVSEVAGRMDQKGWNNEASLKTDLGRNLPSVLVDGEQIEKVLGNLLLNAFQALEDGGLIKIKTEANEEKVILSVSDNGHGMSPEFVERSLFKPFRSTKKKGLGIGLYQCKTIIEAHGGKIEVESEEEKGTTFRILLPAVK